MAAPAIDCKMRIERVIIGTLPPKNVGVMMRYKFEQKQAESTTYAIRLHRSKTLSSRWRKAPHEEV
jgi:hypothetical protein